MKHIRLILTVILLAAGLSSFTAHKFYVAVFQLDHVPAKKVIQVTARIFVDDLEAALNKKYGKQFYIGQQQEIDGTDDFLNKYLTEKMQININGKTKAFKFIGKELEEDVLVCYYTLPADGKIKNLSVKNTTLFEYFPDQQNIIHTNINGNKKSLLLTNSNPQGSLDY